MIYNKLNFLLLSILFFCCTDKALFEEMESSHTGIYFNNLISENDSMNILDYEYLYNGGGAAIADFNNDGKQDIFFTGNMVGNKMYLNEGNWKFNDISQIANIGGNGRWSSGVSIIDINQDGLIDIYISCSTYNPEKLRSNLLYINLGVNSEGIPVFKEMAVEYGLDDSSHNINASFFDYDNDGDLDVYLLINEMDKYKQPNQYRKKVVDGTSPKNDKLLRNDFIKELGHPYFTDVTKEAGILIEGFGLGVCVSDLNQDGWKDIFVSNDYLTNDLLWINNKDGTFTDKSSEYFKHTSYSSMGNNIIDFNNDGLNEVIELDMMPDDNFRRKTMLTENNYNTYINNDRYKYAYQFVRNTLQQNQGFVNDKPIYSEIAMMSGVSGTDWSWAPIVGDYDNDGFNDLIITNGFPKDITDRDFIDYQTQIARFTKKETLLSIIPEVKLKNYAFRNISEDNGIVLFEDVTEKWGITKPTFSNGAAHGDLDNDGDLDYIVNNIDGEANVFKNNSEKFNENNWIKIKLVGKENNINAIGATVELFSEGKYKFYENNPFRGYLSSMQNIIHFGLSDSKSIDSLIIHWPDGHKNKHLSLQVNTSIELVYDENINYKSKTDDRPLKLFSEINIPYNHKELDFIDFNYQPLLYHKLSQFGPGISVQDINGDGLDDFYISGSRNYSGTFFIQEKDGSFNEQKLFSDSDLTFSSEELGVLLFDFDNDSDNDLYIVSGGNEFDSMHISYTDKLFINDGGNFVLSEGIIPNFLSSGSCVKASDYDNDGDLDLFVCGRLVPQDYPTPATSFILQNQLDKGENKFLIVNDKVAPQLNSIGLVSDAIWTDFDNDNKSDLIVVGEYMQIRIFRNNGNVFEEVEKNGIENYFGFWNSINGSDFDKDGDIDYIVGNIGKNTLLNYESNEILVYSSDFDGNKFKDFFPSAYFKDEKGNYKLYPFFTRHEFQKEVIDIRGKYILHEDFGRVTFKQLIQQMNLNNSQVSKFKVNYFSSVYIENLGDGKFKIIDLPDEAQISKVYGSIIEDFNGDGFDDIALVGNDYGSEIGMGRYDALNGLVLLGNSEFFKPIEINNSSFYVPGDSKSSALLVSEDNYIILVGQNKDKLISYKVNHDKKFSVALEPDENIADVYENGKMYRKEFYHGNSFLSQSSRKILLNETIDSIQVYSSNKPTRIVRFDF